MGDLPLSGLHAPAGSGHARPPAERNTFTLQRRVARGNPSMRELANLVLRRDRGQCGLQIWSD